MVVRRVVVFRNDTLVLLDKNKHDAQGFSNSFIVETLLDFFTAIHFQCSNGIWHWGQGYCFASKCSEHEEHAT